MNFTGIELRQEQVDFNNKACTGLPAKYICDDGQNVLKYIKEESQDLLFSCPPYFDLEVYSELENDASNQASYTEYLKILGKALGDSTKALKQDRFAVIVISNVRKDGAYLDLVGDTIRIMEKNGLKLYNDIILATPLGTAPFRARRYMVSRKVAKVHQNVLVFFKGNMDKINEIYPEIKYATEYKS
jgi:DNA modification methylase